MTHPKVRDFRDLIVWQKSMDLIDEVYRITEAFPPEERYGIVSQLRRAVVSVSSNIAEGSGKATTRDLVNFLGHSRGSIKEAESLLLVGERLEFTNRASTERAFGLMTEIGRMLSRLRANLNNKARPGR